MRNETLGHMLSMCSTTEYTSGTYYNSWTKESTVNWEKENDKALVACVNMNSTLTLQEEGRGPPFLLQEEEEEGEKEKEQKNKSLRVA